MTCEWFRGEKSFVPEGQHPKLGDPEMIISFERPADSPWGEDCWLCCEIKAEQDSDVRLTASFYTGEDKMPIAITYELMPNLRITYRIQLREIWNKRHFLPVFPGGYVGQVRGWPLDPGRVTRVELRLAPGRDFRTATLYSVYISDREPNALPEKHRLVDEMGQLISREWPNKTASVEDAT